MTQEAPALYWCSTINNYTDEVVKKTEDWLLANTTYAVCGKEVSETGTPHLQIFFGLTKKQRRSWLSAQFAGWARPHFEKAKADGQTASDYCKKGSQSHEEWDEFGRDGPNWGKDKDVFEHGVIPTTCGPKPSGAQAKRTADYAAAIELAKHRKFNEIDPGMLVRHYGNLQRIAADNPLPVANLGKPCAEWIYGPPGTGKSFTARKENPVFYWKGCNKWWCGYQGEDVVIIDDFDSNHKVLGHHLKIWLDEYAFGAENKGSSRVIRPRKIIVTSNYHPDQIWHDDLVLAEAITRRVTLRYMNEKYMAPDAPVEGPYADNFVPPTTQELLSDTPSVPTPPPRDITDFNVSDHEFSASQVMFFDPTQTL